MAENRNDFFILHGLICSWALSNIIHLMKSTEIKLEILQNFICILLAFYIAKDRPKLNPEYLVTPDVSNLTWENIIAKTIKMPLGTDELEYKVVQVIFWENVWSFNKNHIWMLLRKARSHTLLQLF